jgi:hypothetical protein
MRLRRRLAHLLAVTVVVSGGVVGVVAGTARPAHAVSCYDGWLRSDANGRYVSTELNYTGVDKYMLRARRTGSPGAWEQYEFCWGINNNPAQVAIRSKANFRWVSAELGYGGGRYGMLRARATSIGPWETFNAGYGLRNITNWRWVTAELGYGGGLYGMLRARGDHYGPWEHFSNSGPSLTG